MLSQCLEECYLYTKEAMNQYTKQIKNKAKRLSGTTFAIAKLEELYTYIGSNREKSNIAIAILTKINFDKVPKNYLVFFGHQ